MIKKTFALTLSLSVSAQLAAQTETDYLSGMTPECRQNNPNIVFILLERCQTFSKWQKTDWFLPITTREHPFRLLPAAH